MYRVMVLLVLLAVLAVPAVAAEEEAEAPPEKKAYPPPLPFHTVEGTSGVFTTDMAYICNLADCCARAEGPCKSWLSRPVVSVSAISFGDKDLQAYAVTTCLFHRVEIGYSFQRMGLGGWPQAVQRATGIRVGEGDVELHTVGARLMLVKEGDFGLSWLPAVTAGARFKYNEDIWDIDEDLLGTCRALGVADNEGWDYTVTASKTFAGILPKPFILSAGLRSTKAAHTGLLGFTENRDVVFETSAVFFLTDRLLLAGEYRQKPNHVQPLGTLVGREDDWWDVALGYIVNDHLTVALGYAHFGEVLNNTENSAWALQLKWEF